MRWNQRSSWPGLSRPSTSWLPTKDVDARVKAAHDGGYKPAESALNFHDRSAANEPLAGGKRVSSRRLRSTAEPGGYDRREGRCGAYARWRQAVHRHLPPRLEREISGAARLLDLQQGSAGTRCGERAAAPACMVVAVGRTPGRGRYKIFRLARLCPRHRLAPRCRQVRQQWRIAFVG